jgi:hypothetical protein
MFKTIEIGAWYRIRWEGRSVFGKVLERHRNSCTFRYVDKKGKARTAKVSRSDIFGRLGDHLIADLEAAIAPAKRRKTTKPKAKSPASPPQPKPEPPARMPQPRKASTTRKKRKPSKGQRVLFPE